MLFWTKDEYLKFAEEMKEKPLSYYAFELLYWTGIRCGELLALTRDDFDLEKKTLRINKTFQTIKGKEMVTSPKTEKSNRRIDLPEFLCREMEDYFASLYKVDGKSRLFPVTKYYMHHELDRGCRKAGVKRIRIHDLRHSSCALLINLKDIHICIRRYSRRWRRNWTRHFQGRKRMKNKIFIRPTMEKGRDQKPKDEKARKRNTIINFRVTPEEKNRIEARIALTGLDRAEFFIESCLYQTVLVKGNVRTFREYDRLMKKLAEQINQDVKLENMDSELLES